MNARILLFLLIAVLLLSACQPADLPQTAVEEPLFDKGFGGFAGAPETEGFEAPRAAVEELGETTVTGNASDRMVVKTADLSILVTDPVDTLASIIQMAESMGGFVVSSELYKTTTSEGQEFPRARITVRVPVERLNEALEQIKSGAGEVVNENVRGDDVTQTYTDLQSRLRNLEQAAEQLRGIMEEARRTEDVLQVYNELTRVTEQIEVIKGQMQYYEESAALSAISVDIQAEESIQPLTIGRWQPVGVARDAVQALVNTAQVLVNAAIWVVLYILPVGLMLLLPVLLVIFIIRGVLRRRKAKMLQAAASSEG
jgi:hypothetical protein